MEIGLGLSTVPVPSVRSPDSPLTALWSPVPLHLESGVYAYSALSSSPPGFQKEPCEKKKTSLLLFETTDSRENVLKSLCIWKVMLFKKKEVEKFYSLLKFKNRDHTNDDN